MASKRTTKVQINDGVAALSPAALKLHRNTTRRFAVWNRRAALLRAIDAGPADEIKTFLEDTISNIERAFQNAQWMDEGDAAANLEPITPVPSREEIKALAEANNAAAQRVQTTTAIQELVQLGTTFLNIANGQIPPG